MGQIHLWIRGSFLISLQLGAFHCLRTSCPIVILYPCSCTTHALTLCLKQSDHVDWNLVIVLRRWFGHRAVQNDKRQSRPRPLMCFWLIICALTAFVLLRLVHRYMYFWVHPYFFAAYYPHQTRNGFWHPSILDPKIISLAFVIQTLAIHFSLQYEIVTLKDYKIRDTVVDVLRIADTPFKQCKKADFRLK